VGVTAVVRAQYTAEFMLTRGPYAMLGYSWYGCTGSAAAHGAASPDPPRATEWDVDFGAPSDKRERILLADEPLSTAVQSPLIEPWLTRTRATGEPAMACKETAEGSGIFQREWGKATVQQTTQHTPTISDRTPKESLKAYAMRDQRPSTRRLRRRARAGVVGLQHGQG
jgi:hypothetical protein